jgi:hypothetical protein
MPLYEIFEPIDSSIFASLIKSKEINEHKIMKRLTPLRKLREELNEELEALTFMYPEQF